MSLVYLELNVMKSCKFVNISFVSDIVTIVEYLFLYEAINCMVKKK